MAKKFDLRGAMTQSATAKRTGLDDGAAPPLARPGRKDKVNVTGYFDAGVKTQLKFLSAERSRTIQQLLGEALNDLFAKYHKPEVVALDE